MLQVILCISWLVLIVYCVLEQYSPKHTVSGTQGDCELRLGIATGSATLRHFGADQHIIISPENHEAAVHSLQLFANIFYIVLIKQLAQPSCNLKSAFQRKLPAKSPLKFWWRNLFFQRLNFSSALISLSTYSSMRIGIDLNCE